MQRILAGRGYKLGPPGVDGRFGPLTAAAVRRMQGKHGLVVDGIVGPRTRRVLTKLDPSRSNQPAAQSPETPAQPQSQQEPSSSTGQGPAAARPTTDSRPAQTAEPPADPATRMTLPVILSILAAIVATAPLAVARLRRRRSATALEPDPGDHEGLLERSAESGNGAYRGLALAAPVPSPADDEAGRAEETTHDAPEPAPEVVEDHEVYEPPHLPDGARVIGYVTADPDPEHEQEAFTQVEALCEQAGWDLLEIVREQDRTRTPDRPGLTRALEQIAAGDARGLVVLETRHVIDSLGDLAALLEWFREADAAFVALDLDVDTSTIHGHKTASALMAVAGWEGERRSRRAQSGLVEVGSRDRAGGEPTGVVERITTMRGAGRSLQAIADQLNDEGVPPGRTRRWWPSEVASALAEPRPTGKLHGLPSIRRREQP